MVQLLTVKKSLTVKTWLTAHLKPSKQGKYFLKCTKTKIRFVFVFSLFQKRLIRFVNGTLPSPTTRIIIFLIFLENRNITEYRENLFKMSTCVKKYI